MDVVGLALVLLSLLVLLEAAVTVEILRQIGDLRRALPRRQGAMLTTTEGLLEGTPLPSFSTIRAMDGTLLSIGSAGQETVLVFLTTDCGICQSVAHSLREADPEELSLSRVLFIVKGPDDDAAEFARFHDLPMKLTVGDSTGELAATLAIKTFPAAVIVGSDLTLGPHGVINSVDQALALLAQTRSDPSVSLVAEKSGSTS